MSFFAHTNYVMESPVANVQMGIDALWQVITFCGEREVI